MKRIICIILVFGLLFSVNNKSISAWEENRSSGYARELYWYYGCTNNPYRECYWKSGTNYSGLATNNTNRWIRTSVMRGNNVIRSPKAKVGVSKVINGVIWNQNTAYASALVWVKHNNQRYHDFMRK